MDALNGIVGSSEVYLNVYNQNQVAASASLTEVLPLQTDTAEISKEAKDAQTLASALKRSEKMMALRGLNRDEVAEFRDILKQYEDSGKDTKTFLKSLDFDQRDLVKRANSYGTRFTDANIDSWSKEGAANMLREQDWRFAIDINSDGIVDHGAGKSFVFPPVNSPDAVKDAWEIMSKDMTDKEAMLFTMRFLPFKIEGYPEATTIRDYNLNKQGFPKTSDGWMELLDKIYETEEWSSKTNPHAPSREINKKMMEHITEFKKIINDVRSNEKCSQ